MFPSDDYKYSHLDFTNAHLTQSNIKFQYFGVLGFWGFGVLRRNEQSLGELFCFFILETILLGRALNVNPFDQPSVELIKIETKKILS